MLNQASLEAIATAQINENLGKPLYDTYCFSQIPQAIAHVLTGNGFLGLPADVLTSLPSAYNKVVLLFIDGFGWRFLEQFVEELPFLSRALNQGVVSKLTTQFPSTTSVHTTTIHTGLPIGQSGIAEWYYYEPSLDRVIAPLLYSFYGDKNRETMAQAGVDPKSLFPSQTLYQQLARQGVPSYCFQHQNYARSSFSTTVCDGATMMPYRTVPEAIANLIELLKQPGKGYYHFYIDSVDAISHRYGPDSPQVAAEIRGLFTVLEALLTPTLRRCSNSLLLLSADHGQIEVSEEQTIYLSDRCPTLKSWIQTNQNGSLIVPCGGPRDFFLHVNDESLEAAERYLQETIGEQVLIYRTGWLMEQGYFGRVTDRLKVRLGNLILLPQPGIMIRWEKQAESGYQTRGHHGGLTAAEMEIPLLAIAS